MGICDSTANESANKKNYYNNIEKDMAKKNERYFRENANKNMGNYGNSLALNNDVIISDSKVDIERVYQKIKKIGEGSFGEVWLVKHKILGNLFAMKIIEKSPYTYVGHIQNEINILKKLDHPYILKVLQFHFTDDKIYIITDYCPEGELFNEIAKKKVFSEREAAYIIYQVLTAIRYCHKMNVVHRDVKPENIMIMGRESNGLLRVKLIDFGMAKLFVEGSKNKALVGSAYYIAPEVIEGKYDESCDLWSIGVIMYILLTGKPPFDGEEDDDILKAVSIGKYDTSSERYSKLSFQAKDLIKRLLTVDPSQRINSIDALTHPWFKTTEFTTSYRANSVNTAAANALLKNLENYKSNNIIKCAVLAYLVHQSSNIKECIDASKLFTDIDIDKDGKIGRNELESVYIKFCGLDQNQAKLKANSVFMNIDTDNNGYIESEEFIRACINPKIFTTENYLKFAFDYFDTDKNGSISILEIEEKFFQNAKNQSENTRMKLKAMFSQIDVNGDGEISYQEFSNMIKGVMAS